jgi:hypothetical protein
VDENEKCLGKAGSKVVLASCGDDGTNWVVTANGRWANEVQPLQ